MIATMKWVVLMTTGVQLASGFAGLRTSKFAFQPMPSELHHNHDCTGQGEMNDEVFSTRRSIILGGSMAAVSVFFPALTNAAVGSLPELQDTNVVLQGLTVKVADPTQLQQMITFLQDAFDMTILRGTSDGLDLWLGYGPEELDVPTDFTIPVSAFKKYGGHASIHLKYDSQATSVFYRGDRNAPGNNIAYLQVGVPQYRVTQMVKNGGNVLDAYGFVNVVSPCGLPMRGIVGIWPDPIMFCAINCQSVKDSVAFYEQLGFSVQEYPYCRPLQGKGEFEPPQPKGSVYMAPSPNSMGVLLLPSKKVSPNPIVSGLNLVYTPTDDTEATATQAKDPSGVDVIFYPFADFAAAEKSTRVDRTL